MMTKKNNNERYKKRERERIYTERSHRPIDTTRHLRAIQRENLRIIIACMNIPDGDTSKKGIHLETSVSLQKKTVFFFVSRKNSKISISE